MNISRTVLCAFVAALGLMGEDARPLLSGVNGAMPAWLHWSGEERARMESIAGAGFQPVGDLYLLNRLRVNLDVKPSSWLKFSFQAQDARVFGQNTRPAPASQKDALDLRLGYVQVGREGGWVSLQAGRQSLDFGEARLLGDPNWSNVGRTFDAARLTLRGRRAKVDLFTGAVVKVDPGGFDRRTPAEHVHGVYGSVAGPAPGSTLEPYWIWRLEHGYKSERGVAGPVDEKTVGLRWSGKLPAGFDYTSDIAGQTGWWAGDRIGAWMGHWVVGQTLPDARHHPRWFVEYNRGSGDAASKDGRRGSFDILFPSGHDKYGLTDLFCTSNIVHLRPGFQYTLGPKVKLAAAYNQFWLADARDGLYVGGKLLARSAAGAAGTHVGQEADVQAQWAASAAATVMVGYGHLFPGSFLRQTTAGVPYHIVSAGVATRF